MARRHYGTGRVIPTEHRDRWRIKYRLGRREKTETITGSKRDAEALLRRRLVERDHGGGWVPSEDPLGKTIEAWLRHKAPLLRENTLSNYRCLLGHVLAHPITRTPLAKVSPQGLAELFSDLATSGRGLRTIQAVYTPLGSVFSWAVRMRSIAVNPLAPIERPKAPKPKPRAIERDVLDRILTVIGSADPLLRKPRPRHGATAWRAVWAPMGRSEGEPTQDPTCRDGDPREAERRAAQVRHVLSNARPSRLHRDGARPIQALSRRCAAPKEFSLSWLQLAPPPSRPVP